MNFSEDDEPIFPKDAAIALAIEVLIVALFLFGIIFLCAPAHGAVPEFKIHREHTVPEFKIIRCHPMSRLEPIANAKPAGRTAQIPFSSGWTQDGKHSATVGHLIQHGCPAWVANMYSGSPSTMGQIHSGYHEMSRGGKYTMKTVTEQIAASSAPKPSLPSLGKGQSLSCPNGQCPWARGK